MTATENIRQHSGNSFGQAFIAVMVAWTGLAILSAVRYAPPRPLPASAASDLFSAARAEPILQDLVGDLVPHPVGSQQNQIVREKVVNWLTKFGYDVEIQESSAEIRASFTDQRSDAGQQQVGIFNVIARLKGKSVGPPVVLLAHYDSHPAGPGVSDDAVGTTAVLEIARLLKQEEPPDRDIVFLITDGEEYGLLGAKRFLEETEWASEIHSVVNLEARGTKGPSLMFETGTDSLWAIQLYSISSRKPFTSSLFFEIYKRMPNDTDFTVFKEHGIQGFNFAYIGDVKNYHTPGDNLENTDRGSLQHHGENALSLIREMANCDLDAIPNGRAVYFDLYGWRVIWWPEKITIWIAVIATVMNGLAIFKIQQNGKRPARRFGIGIVASIAVLIASAAILYLVNLGLQLDSVLDSPYPDFPLPVALTYWSAGMLFVVAVSWWNPLKVTWSDALAAQWALWPALAIVTTLAVTGGSYLFVVPALVMGVVSMPVSYSSKFFDMARQYRILILTPPLIAGLIWIPLERMFYDAVGFGMFPVMALRICLLTCALLPVLLWTRQKCRLIFLAVCGGLFVLFVVLATLLN